MLTFLATSNFAVGPDVTLDQDYQIPPLADLDAIIDPLPAFLEALDWEPENEAQSDDNDSEYDVIEEHSTGGEKRSLGSFSGDQEGSSEDSEVDDTHKDGFRRSKRKNQRQNKLKVRRRQILLQVRSILSQRT